MADETVKSASEGIMEDMKSLALASPFVAWMLMQGKPLVARTYSIELRWDSWASGQVLPEVGFAEKFYQPFWVQDITYTLRRPLYAPGVMGKLQDDEYCKRNPYVDITMRQSKPRYDLFEGFQPLENVATTLSERKYGKRGWVLPEDSNLFVIARNNRTLGETEVPYVITLTFSGLELSGCDDPVCNDWDDTICKLRSAGLYPPVAR